MKLKSFLWPIFMALLCGFFASHSMAAKKIEIAKENLGDLKDKIQALKKEMENNQEAHKEAADTLKDSETAISIANKKLREISQQQKQNKTQLDNLKKKSLNLNEKLDAQQTQLSQMLRQQYRHGNHSYTQLVLQNKSPNEITRELKYFSYIAKAHATLIDDMQSNLVDVKQLNQKTADTLKAVSDLKAKQEAERKSLQQQKAEKAKVVKSLSNEIAAQRKEISKLKRDEKSLSNLVERLAKIVPPVKPKPRKKSIKNNQNKTDNQDDHSSEKTVVVSNDTLPSNAISGSQFASLRGKLRLPVRGDLTNRYGTAREDTGVTWKGLFIKASEGSDVKSVADGRIVFADWMRGFGNLIIVDHGSGYMSLYGNNQTTLKQVGDEVDAGDSIAAVGNSGGNESNGVYYELRHNSQPFDPLSWSMR